MSSFPAPSFGDYIRIIRRHGVARPVLGALIASVPIGMLGLATLLMVQRAHSGLGAAGLVVGALGAGATLTMLVQGRLIDRFGHGRVLLPAAVLQLLASGTLVAATAARAPVALLATAAFAVGLGEPQVPASLRALWPSLVPGELRPAAVALSSILFDAPVLVGPVALAGLLLVVPAPAVLLVCSAAFGTGAVLLTSSRASRTWHRRREHRSRSLLGALQSPGVRSAGALSAVLGFTTGGLQVAAASATAAAGAPTAAGWLYALLSAGSLTGAALAGVLRTRRTFLTVAVLSAVLVGLIGSTVLVPVVVAVAGLVVPAGGLLGFLSVRCFDLADRTSEGLGVEAAVSVLAASLAAFAVSTAVCAAAVDRAGTAGALLLAAGASAAGLVVAVALWRPLDQAAAGRS